MKTQTKSKKVNKAWLHDHVNDTYVKQAQREGYRARAAYKLKEIDEALSSGDPRAQLFNGIQCEKIPHQISRCASANMADTKAE